MSECLVAVERDSVCMADDVDAPHFYSFKVNADTTLNRVFEHLASVGYLASVAGMNHSWEAIVGDETLALFKGNNQQPESSSTLFAAISKYAIKGTLRVHFKYNSATT
jgi:hypothetical protein